MVLSKSQYQRWMHKRKLSLITFAFENILIGADFSLTFITLWLYLKELVKPDHPTVYYSIISASYLLASMCFALVLGRVVDKYRRVKLTFLILNFLVVIGNVIYTLQFSPLLLLFGRFLSGMGGPLRSVISGELARCYQQEDLSKYLSTMGVCFSFGFVAGPAVNFTFKDINVFLATWHVTYVNAPGLFLAFLFSIAFFMSIFMVFDLSKEYDLKAEMEKAEQNGVYYEFTNRSPTLSIEESNTNYLDNDTDGIKIKEIDVERKTKETVSYFQTNETSPLIKCKTYNNESTFTILKKLFTNIDTCLLLFVAFFENYFVISFDIWLPMLIVDVIGWSVVEVTIVVFGSGIFCIIACVIMIVRTLSDSCVYIIAICATSSIILIEGTFMFLSHYNDCLPLTIVLFTLMDLFYSFLILTEEVFLVGCLAKMVSSTHQTFVDSIRLSMYRCGGLVALLTSALCFNYIAIVGCIHIILIFIGTILLIIRRTSFMKPKVLIK